MILFAIVSGLFLSGNLAFLENEYTDLRFAAAKRPATGNVVLVEIDANSISEIGVWPWPRRHYATIIDRLFEAGAQRIAFDIDFSARSSSEEDALMADAIANAGGRVILPVFLQHSGRLDSGATLVSSMPLDEFQEHATLASINVYPAEDGLIRELTTTQVVHLADYPTLATSLADLDAGPFDIYEIDYGIDIATIPHLSFADVLRGQFDPAVVAGRQVVIGSTAAELGDQFAVPAYRTIPGVLVHILGYESLAQGRALHRLNSWIIVVLTLGITALCCWLYSKLSWRIGLLAMKVTAAGLFAVSLLVHHAAPVSLDITPMILMALLTYCVSVVRHIDSQSMALLFQSLDIRRKDAMMRHVVENSALGIVTIGDTGEIESINSAVTKMFGYSDEEIVGEPVTKLLDMEVEGEPDAATFIQQTLASGGFRELVTQTRSNEEFFVSMTINEISLDDRTVTTAFLRDITERKRQEQQLEYQATHDELTGLLNRWGLTAKITRDNEVEGASDSMSAIFQLDLDRFTDINNTLGYGFGDRVLEAFAKHLSEYLPRRATLARFGGDVFVIHLPQLSSASAVKELGHSILDEVQHPLTIDDVTLELSGCIGAAIYPLHGSSADQLYQCANVALNEAKRDQTGFALYDPATDPHNLRNLTLTTDLRRAIEREELELVFQPKVDIREQRIYGAEVLTRWTHPEHGPVSPDEFIDHAEQTGLILPLTKWALNTALEKAAEWQNEGRDLNIAVNLSARLLAHPSVLPMITSALKKWNYPAADLTLEVTENAFLDNPEKAMDVVHQIVALGISVSIDDFGTGYSSLAYLKTLGAHELKIDKSFVLNIEKNGSDRMIVKSVTSMAHDLGLKIVAEGVESAAAMDILAGLQCDIGQGYYFGKPMNFSDFNGFLRHNQWKSGKSRQKSDRRRRQRRATDGDGISRRASVDLSNSLRKGNPGVQ